MSSVFILHYHPYCEDVIIAGISYDYNALKEVAKKIIDNINDNAIFKIIEYELSDSSEKIYSNLSKNNFNGISIKHIYKYSLGEHGYLWDRIY